MKTCPAPQRMQRHQQAKVEREWCEGGGVAECEDGGEDGGGDAAEAEAEGVDGAAALLGGRQASARICRKTMITRVVRRRRFRWPSLPLRRRGQGSTLSCPATGTSAARWSSCRLSSTTWCDRTKAGALFILRAVYSASHGSYRADRRMTRTPRGSASSTSAAPRSACHPCRKTRLRPLWTLSRKKPFSEDLWSFCEPSRSDL